MRDIDGEGSSRGRGRIMPEKISLPIKFFEQIQGRYDIRSDGIRTYFDFSYDFMFHMES